MQNFLLGAKDYSDRAIKALVVDSDLKSVHELGNALRSRGCKPLEAASFEAGKALWIAEKPPLLIADIRLGQFNGLQLLLRARADRPDVAAIITCAFPDKVLEAETHRFGGTFVVKPVPPEKVVAVLLALDQPEALQLLGERRRGERRSHVSEDFLPNRRVGDRRRPARDSR